MLCSGWIPCDRVSSEAVNESNEHMMVMVSVTRIPKEIIILIHFILFGSLIRWISLLFYLWSVYLTLWSRAFLTYLSFTLNRNPYFWYYFIDISLYLSLPLLLNIILYLDHLTYNLLYLQNKFLFLLITIQIHSRSPFVWGIRQGLPSEKSTNKRCITGQTWWNTRIIDPYNLISRVARLTTSFHIRFFASLAIPPISHITKRCIDWASSVHITGQECRKETIQP